MTERLTSQFSDTDSWNYDVIYIFFTIDLPENGHFTFESCNLVRINILLPKVSKKLRYPRLPPWLN